MAHTHVHAHTQTVWANLSTPDVESILVTVAKYNTKTSGKVFEQRDQWIYETRCKKWIKKEKHLQKKVLISN